MPPTTVDAPAGGLGLMGLLSRALGWNYGTGLLGLVAQMVYTAVTSRTIPATGFGAYAVGLTLLQVVTYFGGSTIGNAVMRTPEMDRTAIATSLYLSLGMGVVLSALFVVSAAPAAALLHSPGLTNVLLVLAVMPPAIGGNAVCSGILRRHDRYGTNAVLSLVTNLLGFAVGAWMALAGYGVVALVTNQVVSAWAGLLAGVVAVRSDLCFEFSPSAVRQVLPFAVQVSGQNLVHYVIEAMPTWFVTRTAGPASTGYFTRGLQLVSLPAYQLLMGVQRSLYPLYRRLTEPRRLRRALTDVLVVSNGLSCVFFALGAACGPPAARLLLGPHWGPAVQLVPWFCAAAAAQTIYGVASSAAEALAWMAVIWRVQILFVVATVGGLAVAYPHGLRAVTASMLAAAVLSHLAMVLTREARAHLDLYRVARAYAAHGLIGGLLYAVPTATAELADIGSAAVDLLVRAAVAGALLGLVVLARDRIPAYVVVRTRRSAARDVAFVPVAGPAQMTTAEVVTS